MLLLLLRSDLCPLVEDWDGDVPGAQDGVLHFSHEGFLSLARARLW